MTICDILKENKNYTDFNPTDDGITLIEICNRDATRHIFIEENNDGEFIISTNKTIVINLHTNVINL